MNTDNLATVEFLAATDNSLLQSISATELGQAIKETFGIEIEFLSDKISIETATSAICEAVTKRFLENIKNANEF